MFIRNIKILFMKRINNTLDFVIKILVWLLLLLAAVNIATAQVDTEDVFKFERMKLQERNDCTVRAYAVLFNKPYNEAHKKLSEIRKNKEGIQGLIFAKYLMNIHKEDFVSNYNYKEMRGRSAPQDAFLKTRAKKGFKYLIFTYQHVFVIKYDAGKWKSYGNNGDENRDVIAYIEFKD